MMITKTDREKSLQASEFIWDINSSTEVHGYVEPVLKRWLSNLGECELLDLGCGNGYLTNFMKGELIKCTGTDFSSSGIELAKSSFEDVSFFQSQISEALPPEHRNKYKIVTAIEVIEHLLLPRQLFNRAQEALLPKGNFILSAPYHGYLKNLGLALVNQFDRHWHPLRDYGHVKFFSKKTLKELFKEQGFEVKEIVLVGRIPSFARSMIFWGKLM